MDEFWPDRPPDEHRRPSGRTLLSALAASAALHLLLLSLFLFQFSVIFQASGPALPLPPPVMMVDLYGNTDRAFEEPTEPEDIKAEGGAGQAGETSALSELLLDPRQAVADPGAIALGPTPQTPQAQPLGRRASPRPRVRAPELKDPPAKSQSSGQAERRHPRDDGRPKNVYEMLTRTLGRDAQLLGSPTGSVKSPSISRYYNLIMNIFKSRWRSPGLELSSRLVVSYQVTIEPSGRIVGLRLVKPSGHEGFDRSVAQAIKSSSPLPPLPPALSGGRDSPCFWFQARKGGL